MHYAGDVTYTVDGFLSKNADTVSADVKQLLCASPLSPLTHSLAPSGDEAASGPSSPQHKLEMWANSCCLITHGGGGRSERAEGSANGEVAGAAAKAAAPTVAAQFKEQLRTLGRSLSSVQQHYIRCIKPNAAATPDAFDGSMVLGQLASGGVLEALQVRQQCHAVRWELPTFLSRFGCLAETGGGGVQAETTVEAVMKAAGVPSSAWVQGTTHGTVFVRTAEAAAAVEAAAAAEQARMMVRRSRAAVTVQAHVRGWKARARAALCRLQLQQAAAEEAAAAKAAEEAAAAKAAEDAAAAKAAEQAKQEVAAAVEQARQAAAAVEQAEMMDAPPALLQQASLKRADSDSSEGGHGMVALERPPPSKRPSLSRDALEQAKAASERRSGWLSKQTRSRWARLGAAAAWSRLWVTAAGRQLDLYGDPSLRDWKCSMTLDSTTVVTAVVPTENDVDLPDASAVDQCVFSAHTRVCPPVAERTPRVRGSSIGRGRCEYAGPAGAEHGLLSAGRCTCHSHTPLGIAHLHLPDRAAERALAGMRPIVATGMCWRFGPPTSRCAWPPPMRRSETRGCRACGRWWTACSAPVAARSQR